MSKKKLLGDGVTIIKSKLLEPVEDIASTTLKDTLKTMLIKKKDLLISSQKNKKSSLKSVIVESVQNTNQTILIDKLNSCRKNIQTIKSYLTSEVVSTGTEKDLSKSWISQTKNESQKLWLPTETDYVGSHSNSSNGFFSKTKSHSWFTIKKWKALDKPNLQKISCPSLTYSTVDSMDQGNTKKKIKVNPVKKSIKQPPNRIRRIKLFFSPDDKKTVNNWFGCVRKTYNWTLNCIKKKPLQYKLNVPWLRKRFINEINIPKKMKYLLECPKDIRDGALDDLVGAYKINLDKKKTNPFFKFDIKFRSKKEEQSIRIGTHAAKFLGWNEAKNKKYGNDPKRS